MDKGYTTEELIAAYLGVTIPAGDADTYILAAQAYIDQVTGRNFKADTTATARVYDGNNTQLLLIDDCVEIETVEIGSNAFGDSFLETTRYVTMPANELPLRKIGLRDQYFIEGAQNMRITAKWGYSVDVPADISQAATVLASGMYYENKGQNTGAIKSEKIGTYQVSYADNGGFNDLQAADATLATYKRYNI